MTSATYSFFSELERKISAISGKDRESSFFSADRGSDVNKDLGLKAKAKAKDLSHKAKAKAKDSDPKTKAKAKGPKAKAKDSRYQGPIFHRSSPYIICSSLTLCACFYVRIVHIVSL